jgi:hypothetical protein
MSDNYPLSILDHRISMLREKLHVMSHELAALTGTARDELAARVAAETKELDGLVFERDTLAADAR